MKNSIRLACCLLLVTSAHAITAQQVYQAEDFGEPHTIYLYNRLFGFNQDTALTKSGAGITWDLSGTAQLNTHASEIVSPDAAIDFFTFVTICSFGGNSFIECSSIWANTQQAWLLQDTLSLFQFVLADLQRYQRKTSSYLLENFIGFKVNLTGIPQPAVIVYNNPDTILHFPVMFGDQFTSSTSWSLDLSAAGQNTQYQSQQNRTTTIDSWGTLVTPYQTFENVVRMRSVIERQDSISTDSFQAPLNITQVEYMWFDTNYALPVMTANGVINDTAEILGTIEYIYDAVCEAPTWTVSIESDEFIIAPSDSVTIEFTINNGNADAYTWDWGDGEFETTSGSATHTFTQAGLYSVGVTGCMTNCLPLNSCSFQIVDFEILVSVPSIPGEHVGIRIFPNPARDVMQLVIPESIGPAVYSIIDMNGSVLETGITTVGLNKIITSDLSSGLYTIQVTPNHQPVSRQYYSRFTVLK